MKRIPVVLIILSILCGCSKADRAMEQALTFRDTILNGNGCWFNVTVAADYQDTVYDFSMKCQVDEVGNLSFEVTEPESINGITGSVSAEGGKLTFDDQVLLFATMAEGRITPVSAPWLLINALRGGYIEGCGVENDGIFLQICDSYADDAMQLDVRVVEASPVYAEIIWNGCRIITLDVDDFRIL